MQFSCLGLHILGANAPVKGETCLASIVKHFKNLFSLETTILIFSNRSLCCEHFYLFIALLLFLTMTKDHYFM